jgi:hypothetical protein
MPRKRSYVKITEEIVTKTKKYLNDDRSFSKAEVAMLVGISEHSVSRIAAGEYDKPAEAEYNSPTTQDTKYVTEIPYDRLAFLLRCECFINEMFSVAVKSDKDEGELYFPRHHMNNMCDRYFPETKQETLRNLDEINSVSSYDTNA